MRMHDDLLEPMVTSLVEFRRVMFGTIMKKLDTDLPPAQGELLMNVSDGPVKVKDIAANLHISSGAVTQLIDQLEDQALVERFESEEDRRVVWVCISEAGRRRLAKMKKLYAEHFSELLRSLDNEELENLLSSLQKILGEAKAAEV